MTTAFIESSHKGKYIQTSWLHSSPIPDSLKTISVDTFEKILSLAAESIVDFQDKDFKQKFSFYLTQNDIQSEAKTILSKQECEIQKLRNDLDVARQASESLNSKLKYIESEAQQRIALLRSEKDTQYEREISRIQTQAKENTAILERVYSEQQRKSEEQLAKAWAKLEEEKAALQAAVNRGSSLLGQEGEEWFDTLVTTKTTWGSLVNTSKIPHATDRSGKIGKCAVLFEIKNYSNTVPSKEVEKFVRDMEENSTVPFGVFISRKTTITGMKQFLRSEWTHKGQLLLYIANFTTHDIDDILSYIEVCAFHALQLYSLTCDLKNTKEESHVANELQGRIDTAKLYVDRDMKRLAELLTQMRVDEKNLVEAIKTKYAGYKILLEESKTSLQSLLGALFPAEKKEEPVTFCGNEEPPAPSAKGKKKSSAKTTTQAQ